MRTGGFAPPGFAVRVVHEDGRGILREVLGESMRRGFAVQRVTTAHLDTRPFGGMPAVAVMLDVLGQPAVEGLVPALDALPGVLEITTAELGRDTE